MVMRNVAAIGVAIAVLGVIALGQRASSASSTPFPCCAASVTALGSRSGSASGGSAWDGDDDGCRTMAMAAVALPLQWNGGATTRFYTINLCHPIIGTAPDARPAIAEAACSSPGFASQFDASGRCEGVFDIMLELPHWPNAEDVVVTHLAMSRAPFYNASVHVHCAASADFTPGVTVLGSPRPSAFRFDVIDTVACRPPGDDVTISAGDFLLGIAVMFGAVAGLYHVSVNAFVKGYRGWALLEPLPTWFRRARQRCGLGPAATSLPRHSSSSDGGDEDEGSDEGRHSVTSAAEAERLVAVRLSTVSSTQPPAVVPAPVPTAVTVADADEDERPL